MAKSYNGWPLASSSQVDNSPIPGTSVRFAPGFLKGDVAFVFQQFFARYHREVEPLTAGWCWGFVHKPSANDPSLNSCHGSATAGDANAPKHPNGKYGTFSPSQIAAIRKLQADFDGLIYWGGDAWGRGTIDSMHFEIKTGVTPAQVSALANKLRGASPVDEGGLDMATPYIQWPQEQKAALVGDILNFKLVKNFNGDLVSLVDLLNGIETRAAALQGVQPKKH